MNELDQKIEELANAISKEETQKEEVKFTKLKKIVMIIFFILSFVIIGALLGLTYDGTKKYNEHAYNVCSQKYGTYEYNECLTTFFKN